MAEIPHLPRARRRAVIALGATVLVGLLVAGYLVRHGSGHAVAAPDSPAPSPVATGVPTSAAPDPAPSPSATTPNEVVAAAAPSTFRYAGHGYTVRAKVCGMAYVRPLDPPGEQHHTVCWVRHDFGFAPGTDGRGTTYLLGHSWGQDPQEVLNAVSQRAMQQVLARKAHGGGRRLDGVPIYPVTRLDGDVITLRTPNGTLHYTVRDAYAVSKERAGDIRSLMAEHTAKRVVLITCGERNHVDYDYNVIVEAYLSSSVASGAKT